MAVKLLLPGFDQYNIHNVCQKFSVADIKDYKTEDIFHEPVWSLRSVTLVASHRHR